MSSFFSRLILLKQLTNKLPVTVLSQELKNAEITQRTHDIPPVLQHENIAPQEYFQRLVESFEERMQVYRKHIEVMESHLTSLSQGQTLTPQGDFAVIVCVCVCVCLCTQAVGSDVNHS